MKKGDLAFFYHSNEGMEIVGIAMLTKEHYPDPSSNEPAWSAVDFKPYKEFNKPVSLQLLKQNDFFKNMDLIRLARLSVGKVTETEFYKICDLGGVKL